MSNDDDTCHKYTRILDVDDDTNVQLCYIRVYTGFEWNKYNQTHYDFDNPPPQDSSIRTSSTRPSRWSLK